MAAFTPPTSPTPRARCSWISRRWSGRDDILEAFGVPRSMMPEIRSSSEVYGNAEGSSLLRETPIAGILGDQQAATFGQAAFEKGESKNTYGTGCFLIFNTGEEVVHSKNGLLTTVGYKLETARRTTRSRALIAVTGSLIQWLRDQLGIISTAPEVEELADKVEDNGGVYIVPAFWSVRTVLASRCPRRDRGPDPLREQEPHRAPREWPWPSRLATCSTRSTRMPEWTSPSSRSTVAWSPTTRSA